MFKSIAQHNTWHFCGKLIQKRQQCRSVSLANLAFGTSILTKIDLYSGLTFRLAPQVTDVSGNGGP
jgi:hypothetical protein